jgi:hypothetical protein
LYLPINIFLNRSAYFEDLIVELYEIAKKKRELYKKYDNFQELNIPLETSDDVTELLSMEYKILNELIKANASSAQDFGFIKYDDSTGKTNTPI